MTVSPNQLQDGSQPKSSSIEELRFDAPHASDPLPPTLFSLPNLRADSAPVPAASATQAVSQGASETMRHAPPAPEQHRTEQARQPKFPDNPATVADAPIIPEDAPVVTTTRTNVDAADQIRAIADPAELRDSASQTSLLDRIGSHAIVLVMLLIVFGIALLAGRKPVVEPLMPLATQSEERVAPMANSGWNDPETAGPVLAVEVQAEPPHVDVAASPIHSQPSTGISASTVSARSANVPADNSAVTAISAGKVSETLQSTETPIGDTPTAGVTASTEMPNFDAARPTPYRYSKTPQKIDDWSRYLKSVDTSYVTPTSATATQP